MFRLIRVMAVVSLLVLLWTSCGEATPDIPSATPAQAATLTESDVIGLVKAYLIDKTYVRVITTFATQLDQVQARARREDDKSTRTPQTYTCFAAAQHRGFSANYNSLERTWRVTVNSLSWTVYEQTNAVLAHQEPC